ncbi:hypothetical protein O1611_g4302 [Lasiodiplodia mahajangana]|uniref:Uncharacterized protein n=1 Tax=Lasiodiplodia mahajangana TaxID=1108764 RepID=A0ACC2JPB6_9PEZI|nr:hypothetical protein O1611_g4302 [Lasiodiplodia mahajangana]
MSQLMEMARVTLFGSRNTGNGASFEPARDIPSLAGKVVLITGAVGDLGRSTAVELARYGRPACIYVADLPRKVQPDINARFVVVSSEGHAVAPTGGIRFSKLKSSCADMSYLQRYGQSKLALIGFTRELARYYPRLTTAAVHLGWIITGMAKSLATESVLIRFATFISYLICVPVFVGIRNHLWAATSSEVVSGKYYELIGVLDRESKIAKDENLSKELWEWIENELKLSSVPLK